MKKLTYFVIITFILILFGCTTDQAGSQTVTTETTNQPGGGSGGNGGQTPSTTIPNGDSNKITSLQILINSDKVQNGTLKEIDLSKYTDITNYNATINKAVTIKGNESINLGATLEVVADGVKLDGIKGASVTTQSSLKISGSSLSSLSIAAVSSSNANQIIGRGYTSAQPPVVEVDKTEVEDDVSVGIANAYLTVKEFTAKKNISLDAVNVQLTINDKASNIKEIKTDQVCQVILEDGTSDTIPTPNVSGDGELKQIDMKAAGEMKLLALTPMSGLTTVAKQGEAIDFSTAVVLGTYQADDGVTVFKAGGLSYNLTETFSKLEKDFTISIKDKGVVYADSQNVSTFSWTTLEAGKYTAVIDIDYKYKEESYKSYEFEIVIIGAAENQTEIVIPTFTLTAIDVQQGSVKTEYAEGEPLNLSGLIVMGTWTASVGNITYQSVVMDYTLDPPNGTTLKTSDTVVTVKAGGFEQTVPITVKSMYKIIFVTDVSGENSGTLQKIMQGEKITKPDDPTKTGYTFGGWYEKDASALFDFNTIVTSNITLYAKWTANEYTITYYDRGGAEFSGVMTNKPVKHTYGNPTALVTPTKQGFEFRGWFTKSDCSDVSIDTLGATAFTEDITLYALFVEHGAHTITYHTDHGDNSVNKISFKETTDVELHDLSADGYTFGGWFDNAQCSGTAITKWDKGTKTGDVELWAKWTANTYKIVFKANSGTGNDVTQDMTYNVTANLTSCAFIKQGYTFSGWAETSDGNAKYDDNQNVANLAKNNNETICLYAVWTANIYQIRFNANSDTGITGTMDNQNMTYNELPVTLTSCAFTKIGYSFDGWAAIPDGLLFLNDRAEVAINLTSVNGLIIDLYAIWTANTYKVTLNNDGTSIVLDVTYDTIVPSITVPTKTGYTFGGYYLDNTNDGTQYIDANGSGCHIWDVAGNKTLYVKWTPNTNTPYKVEHWLQNVDDNDNTCDSTENKTGTTGALTEAAAKGYDHFTAGTVTQLPIAADGSTVVKIYYTRDTIEFTFYANGGEWDDNSSEKTISGLYQTSALDKMPDAPTREGYTFSGWDENDGTPDEVHTSFDRTIYYTAVWTNANIITVEIAQNSNITVTKDVSGDKIILTAADGYTDYKWYKDNEEIATGNILTLMKAELLAGAVYQISLEAEKNGIIYGAQIAVKKE